MEQRSVARAVEVAEGLADIVDRESSPELINACSHDKDRHEHLVGDVGELEGHGRGSGGAGPAGAGAAARAAQGVKVEVFGQERAHVVGDRRRFFRCFRAGRALAFRLPALLGGRQEPLAHYLWRVGAGGEGEGGEFFLFSSDALFERRQKK